MREFINYFIVLVFLCFSFNSFSQIKKKYYYDENKAEISSKKFDKKVDSGKFITNVIDIDTAFVAVLFPHKIIDKLDTKSHQQLNQYIFDLYNGKVDTTKTMIIYFLPYEKNKKWKESKIGNHKIYNDEFLNELKNDSLNEMLWIYQPETKNMSYHHIDRIPWKADFTQLVQSMFFPLISFTSIAVIRTTGDYLLLNGFDGLDMDYASFLKKLQF